MDTVLFMLKASRRARLAVAVHSDDRHLDPGTGELVTMVLRRSLVMRRLVVGCSGVPFFAPRHTSST